MRDAILAMGSDPSWVLYPVRSGLPPPAVLDQWERVGSVIVSGGLWADAASTELLKRLDTLRGMRIEVLQMPAGDARLQGLEARGITLTTPARASALAPEACVAEGWWLHGGKRCWDICLASIFLILSGWLILLLAGLIILTDGRPAFYRRRVVGRGFREFDAYKLRTMVADADLVLQRDPRLRRQFEEQFKLRDDPRVTPLGRLLRRSSLDELPQLVNVLRGDMSLIGPRMMTKPELDRYGDTAAMVLSVRPGISGLWQVSGRQLTDPEARKRFDLQYVRQASPRFDLYLLWRTIVVLLSTKGAW